MKFNTPDPLGGGLREQIRDLRANPEGAIDLFEQPTGEGLGRYIEELGAVMRMDETAIGDFDPQEN